MRAFYKRKNVLVTGGAGFIGSQLAHTLCLYGANVTVLDDLSTGSINNIAGEPNIRFIASDITSLKSCIKATKKQSFIFHAAAFVSVPESLKHPELCKKINVDGTYNILEASRINNVSTVIFSSSAAIYGERTDCCCEKDKPNPQSPYAQSKLDGEKLCREYAKEHSLNTACLRYFNVYGTQQNPHGTYAGVVAKFTHNLLHEKPIIIYGDGKQKRDFVPVEKVVEANLLVAMRSSLNGDIFNIATGSSITLLNLIKNLEKETKKCPVEIKFKPARSGDIFASHASCKKYKSLLS
jgi:UDP-glucose 4-epimerase